MNQQTRISSVVPFSLKDAPAFIESQMPVGRMSAEAYKERKAGAGQTLTSLGSYWKGRKPLILVRATVLGCLLPATDDRLADLRVFLMLMGMDNVGISRRLKSLSPKAIDPAWPRYAELVKDDPKPQWRAGLSREARLQLTAEWVSGLPYDAQVAICARPDDLSEETLLDGIWPEVNHHLGTSARSFSDVIEQLGIMRFGRRPRVADTFCGGGSIPFEAARMGCDVWASDLNPIATMLTWASYNIIGADRADRERMEAEQAETAARLDAEMTGLGVEQDEAGNRAKAFLYCLETRCPKTGWMVPMSPTWVISTTHRVAAVLIPDHAKKHYDIEVVTGADEATMLAASKGTARDGRLRHPMNPQPDGVSISVIRGDYRDASENRNRLRLWEKTDFRPRPNDIWQERLYAIQWITKASLDEKRQETFYASVTADDLAREGRVEQIVRENLAEWQSQGIVPDMPIARGEKTDEPIRTRGWTYWHHLFAPRQLLLLATKYRRLSAAQALALANDLNFNSKLCAIHPRSEGSGREMCLDRVFINQALNTLSNYGVRSSAYPADNAERIRFVDLRHVNFDVKPQPAVEQHAACDVYVTDPPYADAVNYHEITEYFIAWLRNRAPFPFDRWTWDSQRKAAIKGVDEHFRSEMAAAYKAMATSMSEGGMQVVMFTHQDAGVWADLAAIMWAAGLRVSAAWNIITETVSAQRQGNYVQGTILLVLRTRTKAGNAKRMDIEGEIEDAVDQQLKTLNDLSQDWTAERLYTDGDLQLAAYAAALRVITNYETIDRVQVGADVYRKTKKGERTVIRDLIDYAASVANNKLVPDNFPAVLWRDLDKTSRFYVRMLDMESKGATKFADYQDFAKTFSVDDHTGLMADTKANQASLAGAATLRGGGLTGDFGTQPLRRVLFATWKTMQKGDPKYGLNFLRLEFSPDYWSMRSKLIEFARYLSAKTARTRPDESAAADLLMQKLEVDRL